MRDLNIKVSSGNIFLGYVLEKRMPHSVASTVSSLVAHCWITELLIRSVEILLTNSVHLIG